ncbi:MAG TPA: ATP-dependent acyl-CoA ligase [Xanthobacteraceae bacterium]|jgi:crotonobetaine/carnitine-CoA ligase|nr:ATP-dependent acyl-CoA ligase [Xanthobacteraceae bacterium]
MSAADILAAFPPSERTLPAMLQKRAQRYGERLLVKAGDATLSFAQAPDFAARFAGTLAEAGIRPGDRVALMCSNRIEFVECFTGCAWLGAIAVPINIAARGPQLQHILNNSGARLLIIETELLNALDHVDTSALPLERIWLIGQPTKTVFDRIAVNAIPSRAAPVPPGATDPAQLLAILYTSGTTGPSKGVCCPQAQYFWWGINGIRNLEIREGDVLCTTLPLFHSNALGTFYKAILSGSTLIAEPRFSASQFWQNLIDRRATATYVLGAMVPILLSREPSPQEKQHSVRCGLGPGVPANLHIAFTERTGIRLIDGYGSTETNFVIGSTTAEQRPGSMGTVGEGYHARVLDRNGEEARPGEPGELALRSDEMLAFATGYFAMPDKTAESFRDGWFYSGDRVIREADGQFRFVDRLKDAIRRRGENISSFEVEQVLLSHPDVGTAAVFPVASELAEDEVMAAIVRRPGSTLSEIALSEFCRPRLARFAVPRFIEFVDALPMTENGKVQKYKLRDRGITSGTWDHDRDATMQREKRRT